MLTVRYSIVTIESLNQQVIVALVERRVFTSIIVKNSLLTYFRDMGHDKLTLLCCLEKGYIPLYYGPQSIIREIKKIDINTFLWQTITV